MEGENKPSEREQPSSRAEVKQRRIVLLEDRRDQIEITQMTFLVEEEENEKLLVQWYRQPWIQ